MTYTIDEQNLERQRLLGKVYTRHTDDLLDSLELSPGARCLDLGCGIGETTRQIARRLGDSGEVIGLDIDAALLEVARNTPLAGGARITYQQGDALKLEFEDGSFDLVFARYLLAHLPPEVVLSEMLRVCEPGGVVAVQEGDFSRFYCFPQNWAIERIPGLWSSLWPNPTVGLMLPTLFHQLGYTSVKYNFELAGLYEGDTLKRLHRLTHEATGPALIKQGLFDESEFEAMRAEFERIEQDDSVYLLGFPLFYAWVRRR